MTTYHACLERADESCLYTMLEYFTKRREESEDNYAHAKRQGNTEMMLIYNGAVDNLRCAESEIIWTIEHRKKGHWNV